MLHPRMAHWITPWSGISWTLKKDLKDRFTIVILDSPTKELLESEKFADFGSFSRTSLPSLFRQPVRRLAQLLLASPFPERARVIQRTIQSHSFGISGMETPRPWPTQSMFIQPMGSTPPVYRYRTAIRLPSEIRSL